MIYLAMIGLMIILAFPYLIYQSKKPLRLYWTMDDEVMESCLYAHGCFGRSVSWVIRNHLIQFWMLELEMEYPQNI